MSDDREYLNVVTGDLYTWPGDLPIHYHDLDVLVEIPNGCRNPRTIDQENTWVLHLPRKNMDQFWIDFHLVELTESQLKKRYAYLLLQQL